MPQPALPRAARKANSVEDFDTALVGTGHVNKTAQLNHVVDDVELAGPVMKTEATAGNASTALMDSSVEASR